MTGWKICADFSEMTKINHSFTGMHRKRPFLAVIRIIILWILVKSVLVLFRFNPCGLCTRKVGVIPPCVSTHYTSTGYVMISKRMSKAFVLIEEASQGGHGMFQAFQVFVVHVRDFAGQAFGRVADLVA